MIISWATAMTPSARQRLRVVGLHAHGVVGRDGTFSHGYS